MPTYEITAPDGKRYEVSGDGTAEQALAHFQSMYKPLDKSEYDPSSKEFQSKYGPTSGMGTVDKLRAGVGKAFMDLGRGLGQLNENMPSAQDQFGLSSTPPPNAEQQAQAEAQSAQKVMEQRQQDAPLMQTGAGKIGNLAGNIAIAAPTSLIPGANTVAGAGVVGAGLGMLQPAASTQERLMNTGLGGAFGAGGQLLGQKVGGWAASKLAERKASAALAKQQNAVRDATLEEGARAGLVVPPSTTNPTMANTALESIAGKAATQSAASRINQQGINKLIRNDLAIPDATPLTRETLKSVRTEAGKAYEAVKQTGDVLADQQYLDDIVDIVGGNPVVNKAFPGAKVTAEKDVVELADSLLQPKFTAEAAVEYAKRLRSQAKENFKSSYASGSPEKLQLAHAQWNAAGALEDAIERNLSGKGMGELMQNFRGARQTIAKSYSAEAALNEGTGNIVASKLVQQLRKGKPLSGGFETIAKFAQVAPKAMAEPTQSGGVSALSAMLASGGIALGHPGVIALPVARLLTKRAILSKALQSRALPKYSPSRTGTALLQSSRGLGRIGGPLAASAYAAEQ